LEKIEDEKSAAYEAFVQALETICFDLVKMMAKDGEGATKLLEIEVINAASRLAAAKIAKAVAGSNLVKAAFFGQDANWGRIICAMGYAGAAFKPGRAEISLESDYGKETVMKNGAGTPFSEENAALILTAPEIRVIINLNDGNFTAKAWGCDLTFDYVKINGSYRT
jgi:glutamate N-acetyltransferase/amino-acid N-acetyltransferase